MAVAAPDRLLTRLLVVVFAVVTVVIPVLLVAVWFSRADTLSSVARDFAVPAELTIADAHTYSRTAARPNPCQARNAATARPAVRAALLIAASVPGAGSAGFAECVSRACTPSVTKMHVHRHEALCGLGDDPSMVIYWF